jgi:hypothetical protein
MIDQAFYTPDNGPVLELGVRLRRKMEERQKLIDAQIAMGWGATNPDKIPADWRTKRGPEKKFTEEQKARVREGRRRGLETRQKNIGGRKIRSKTKCFDHKGA